MYIAWLNPSRASPARSLRARRSPLRASPRDPASRRRDDAQSGSQAPEVDCAAGVARPSRSFLALLVLPRQSLQQRRGGFVDLDLRACSLIVSLALQAARMRGPVHLDQLVNRDVGVNLGRLQTAVPEHRLDEADIGTTLQHVGGAASGWRRPCGCPQSPCSA